MATSSICTKTTGSVVVVGTIVSYLSAPFFLRAFHYIAGYIFGNEPQNPIDKDAIQVQIKTTNKVLPVQLSPKWSIAQVKHHLASFLGREAEELRIIVAGHELRDDVRVGDCDLGESTVIHAVKVIQRPVSLPSPQSVHVQQDKFTKNLDVNSLHSSRDEITNLKDTNNSPMKGDKPMNECLLDLQLTEEERITLEKEKRNDEKKESATYPRLDANKISNNKIPDEHNIAASKDEKLKARFWVYCSEIQCGRTIQPGKLRVRCESCKEGAIILNSDPCSWEDVLNPGRVNGYCQNDNCIEMNSTKSPNESKLARIRPVEFYFKCYGPDHDSRNLLARTSAHSTKSLEDIKNLNSEAPPLYHIRSNLKEIPCLACSDNDLNPVLVFDCPDHHVICVPCFRQYCISRLNDRSFTLDQELGYTLGCPVGCENSLIAASSKHFSAVLNNLQNSNQNNNDYERYLRFAAEEFVLQSGGILCPQPNCGTGIMPDEDEKSISPNHVSNVRKVVCTDCKYVFCRNCLQGYHIGDCNKMLMDQIFIQDNIGSKISSPTMNILTNRDLASRARWISEDERTSLEQNGNLETTSSWVAIRVTTKPCPKCRTPTERAGGCMHMECVKAGCGFQWCWICQTEWTRECMGNHWFG